MLGGWGLNGRRVTNWAQGRDGCLNNVTRKFGMKMKERKGNCPLSVGKGSLVKVKNICSWRPCPSTIGVGKFWSNVFSESHLFQQHRQSICGDHNDDNKTTTHSSFSSSKSP